MWHMWCDKIVTYRELLGVIVGSKGKEQFRRPLHKVKGFLNGPAIQNSAPTQLRSLQKIQSQSWQCWIVNKQASMLFLGSVLGSSGCWVRGSICHVRSAEMFLPQLRRLQEKYNLDASPCSNFEQIFHHPPATSHNFIGTTDISHLVYIYLFYCRLLGDFP